MLYFLAFIFVYLLRPSLYSAYSPAYIISLTFFSIVLVLVYWINKSRKNKNWVRFDVLFVISFLILHFQIPALEAFGYKDSGIHMSWFNYNTSNYVVWLSSIALIALLCGFSAGKYFKVKTAKRGIRDISINTKMIDVFLIFLFLSFLVVVGREFLSGEYSGSRNWGAGTSHILRIFNSVLFLRIIYFFVEYDQSSGIRRVFFGFLKNTIFSAVLLSYLAIFVLAGSRGELLRFGLAIAAAYALFIRPVSLKFLLSAILIGSTFFTILGLGRVRDVTGIDENIFVRGINALGEAESFSNLFLGLAYSIRVLFYAVEYIPDKHPYLYGESFVRGVLDILPFSGAITQNFLELSADTAATSVFYNHLIKGVGYTGGMGAEILADIYTNFGEVGVVVCLFLLGLFVIKIERSSKRLNTVSVIIAIVLVYYSIYWNRSMYLFPLKTMAYILFFHYLFLFMSRERFRL